MDKVITETHLHVTLMLIFLGSNLVIDIQNLVMRGPLTETMTWVAAEILGDHGRSWLLSICFLVWMGLRRNFGRHGK
jgi:hypothetical protein